MNIPARHFKKAATEMDMEHSIERTTQVADLDDKDGQSHHVEINPV